MYPKEFKEAVLAKYPDARVTSIGPLGVSFSIPNGMSPSGNKRERVIARYSSQTKTWKILSMNYDCLPNKEELDRFIFNRIPTGSFLEAVISNDLKEAVGRADENNMPLLHLYVKYLYNEAPATCWGSREKYDYWLAGRYEQPEP